MFHSVFLLTAGLTLASPAEPAASVQDADTTEQLGTAAALRCSPKTCARTLWRGILDQRLMLPPPRLDPALEEAALRHAKLILREPGQATWSGVLGSMRSEGLADAQILPFSSTGRDLGALNALFVSFLRSRGSARGYTHAGIATEFAPDGRWSLVAFFVRRLAELPPLPRSPRAPGFLLAGTLLEGRAIAAYAEIPCPSPPRARFGGEDVVSVCKDRVEKLPVELSGQHFELMVPVRPRTTGTHRVELLVTTDRGPEVTALWTFPEAKEAREVKEAEEEKEREPRGQEMKALRRAIEELRSRYEVGPLRTSRELETAASAYAQSVCRLRLAAHILPGLGAPPDRARTAGYLGPVAENLAIAESIGEAHKNLIESPSHLLNLVDPAATVIGVGIAKDETGTPPIVCLVEMFGLGTVSTLPRSRTAQ